MIHSEITLHDLFVLIRTTGSLITAMLDLGEGDFLVYKFSVIFQAAVLNKVCIIMLRRAGNALGDEAEVRREIVCMATWFKPSY